MAISKFTPQSAKKDTGRTIGDNEVAKLANLNKMVDQVNAEFANFNPGGGTTLDVVTVGTLGTSPYIVSFSTVAYLNPQAGTQSASVVNVPTITIGGMGGFSGTLSSISFPTLTTASISISGISTLTSIDLPEFESVFMPSIGMMGGLSFSNNPSLTTINIPALVSIPNNFYMGWNANAFSQATVDHILVRMVATNATGGQLYLNGGTSAAPSSIGLAAISTLQGRGWNIQTN